MCVATRGPWFGLSPPEGQGSRLSSPEGHGSRLSSPEGQGSRLNDLIRLSRVTYLHSGQPGGSHFWSRMTKGKPSHPAEE